MHSSSRAGIAQIRLDSQRMAPTGALMQIVQKRAQKDLEGNLGSGRGRVSCALATTQRLLLGASGSQYSTKGLTTNKTGRGGCYDCSISYNQDGRTRRFQIQPAPRQTPRSFRQTQVSGINDAYRLLRPPLSPCTARLLYSNVCVFLLFTAVQCGEMRIVCFCIEAPWTMRILI